jgi:hypothetical protein
MEARQKGSLHVTTERIQTPEHVNNVEKRIAVLLRISLPESRGVHCFELLVPRGKTW